MIRAITSARGKPAIEDKNHFRYTANGGNTEVSWFRCKDRKCKATLTTRKGTNELVGHDSGRRQASKDAKERIKWLIDHFRTTPEKEYILTMAHELMKSYSSANLH